MGHHVVLFLISCLALHFLVFDFFTQISDNLYNLKNKYLYISTYYGYYGYGLFKKKTKLKKWSFTKLPECAKNKAKQHFLIIAIRQSKPQQIFQHKKLFKIRSKQLRSCALKSTFLIRKALLRGFLEFNHHFISLKIQIHNSSAQKIAFRDIQYSGRNQRYSYAVEIFLKMFQVYFQYLYLSSSYSCLLYTSPSPRDS